MRPRYLYIATIISFLTACGEEIIQVNDYKEIIATALALDKHTLTIEKGSHEIINATFTPDNATDKRLEWVSLNTSVATVDEGVVVGISPGLAEIVVSSGNLVDKCEVTVVISPSSISLKPNSLTLEIGQREQLEASILPEDTTYDLVWSSDNESIASVSEEGEVIAVGVGSTDIIAKVGDKRATCRVVVFMTPVESIELNESSLYMAPGQSATLTAKVIPSNATDGNVLWSSSNDAVAKVYDDIVYAIADGSAIITATAGGISTSCFILVDDQIITVVDLGLSIKWAKCNLGASSLTEYGDYFAWGEVETKSRFAWETYIFCPSGQYFGYTATFSKYCPTNQAKYWAGDGQPDNKTTLDLEDDAANVILGGNWRLPTDAEWTELIDNCSCIWAVMNDVNGCLMTSKKNGNSIFLPAAGGVGSGQFLPSYGGHYWSSSLNENFANEAFGIFLDSRPYISRTPELRFSGQSIRPVTE